MIGPVVFVFYDRDLTLPCSLENTAFGQCDDENTVMLIDIDLIHPKIHSFVSVPKVTNTVLYRLGDG